MSPNRMGDLAELGLVGLVIAAAALPFLLLYWAMRALAQHDY